MLTATNTHSTFFLCSIPTAACTFTFSPSSHFLNNPQYPIPAMLTFYNSKRKSKRYVFYSSKQTVADGSNVIMENEYKTWIDLWWPIVTSEVPILRSRDFRENAERQTLTGQKLQQIASIKPKSSFHNLSWSLTWHSLVAMFRSCAFQHTEPPKCKRWLISEKLQYATDIRHQLA